AGKAFSVGVVCQPLAVLVTLVGISLQYAVAACCQDMFCTRCLQQADDCVSGCANTRDDDPYLGKLFANNFQGVVKSCLRDDGGTVLIIVEDWNVEFFAKTCFDFKATWRGYIFKVNAAVGGCDRFDDTDDFFGISCVQSDWPRVDVGELLEEDGLAFHDRHSGFWANVT